MINSMRLRLRSTHDSTIFKDQIFHGEFRKLFSPYLPSFDYVTFHQPLFFTTEFPHRREENRVIFQLQEEEKQKRKFSLQKSNKPFSPPNRSLNVLSPSKTSPPLPPKQPKFPHREQTWRVST